MLEDIDLTKVLVLDIETVSQKRFYAELEENWKKHWEKKMRFQIKDDVSAEGLYEMAAIQAEFGKIICISCGYFTNEGNYKFKVKSFYGDDEKKLLEDFNSMLNKYYSADDKLLCAHNGKEFDFPFIARRTLINGLKIPAVLDVSGKKPWEVHHLDTMHMWKFGDYKNYTSLILLAELFGIESPKDDIDGSQVGKVYWEEKDLYRIVKYCQKDVVTVAQLLLKFKGEELLKENEIIFTEENENNIIKKSGTETIETKTIETESIKTESIETESKK